MDIIDQFTGFCSTPSIFPKTKMPVFRSFEFPQFEITDELREDLLKIDHPRNSVLGKRMESFFEVAIRHSERYRLIDSNIQIIQNKNTLGEIDFLLYDEVARKTLHVELVYKLYIYDEQFSPGINRWIGPNRRDSFPEKLKKLKDRQFPILYKPETLAYLEKLGLASQDIEQQLCFKAKLFTPSDFRPAKDISINPECYTGEWYSFSDFQKFPWQENLFFSPVKKDWSASPEKNEQWLDHGEIVKTMQALFQRKKAPLIWMKTENTYKSFFVVWW